MQSKVLQLLKHLEQELTMQNLWQTQPPSGEALASTQPFCIDTLSFEQWLQFIFIVKIKLMIEQGMTLPSQISLTPMAEEAFKHLGEKANNLIKVIADIDATLSNQ
ncbi:YqcC family protein [Thalassotalea crassostreae]|uniref:YqcC family protein n=1 Tax=Thalassotalea crassostreae TaxID=1763536 RepID=UPI00083851D8|nr:YqcC family protein [Thalassotalea crassostreae]